MGRRGPPKKTSSLNGLAGNPGKRGVNESEPSPNPLMDLKPPVFLNLYAKQEWKRIVPKLSVLGLLGDIDRAALAGYCNAYGTWEEANRLLRKQGLIVEVGKNGHLAQNPLLQVVNKQSDMMKGYLVEFGMTPAARTRVAGDSGEDPADGFTDLVNRKRGGEG